jgi:hypothetical protein
MYYRHPLAPALSLMVELKFHKIQVSEGVRFYLVLKRATQMNKLRQKFDFSRPMSKNIFLAPINPRVFLS